MELAAGIPFKVAVEIMAYIGEGIGYKNISQNGVNMNFKSGFSWTILRS
jgi:hypothetical protein